MTLIREFLARSDFLLFPQIALVVFFTAFVAVLVAAHRMRRSGEALERLTRLPLEDDAAIADRRGTEGSAR